MSLVLRSNIGNTVRPYTNMASPFGGKRILEIGASNVVNFKAMFPGAVYESISFEESQTYRGNFMDLDVEPYSLIISLGVFEENSIDRMCVWHLVHPEGDYYNNERLRKLAELTVPGGYNIHASRALPILFSNREIEAAGFDVVNRSGKFISRAIPEMSFIEQDLSELVVMRKRLRHESERVRRL